MQVNCLITMDNETVCFAIFSFRTYYRLLSCPTDAADAFRGDPVGSPLNFPSSRSLRHGSAGARGDTGKGFGTSVPKQFKLTAFQCEQARGNHCITGEIPDSCVPAGGDRPCWNVWHCPSHCCKVGCAPDVLRQTGSRADTTDQLECGCGG